MQFDDIYDNKRLPNPYLRLWGIMHKSILTRIGLYGVLTLLLLCIVGDLIAPYTADQQFLNYQLIPPAWSQNGHIPYFLGTDDLGRDILSRLLNGISATFGSAIIVTCFAGIIGVLLGVFMALKRPFFTTFFHQLMNALLTLPSLLIAIIIVAFIGASLLHTMLAVWLAIFPQIVRTVYTAMQAELDKEYVAVARLDGGSMYIILWEDIFPNILTQLTTELTRALSISILEISALGFLHLGAQPPSSELGLMIGDSLDLIYIAPWCVMLPGMALFITVFLVNLLGDGIRRALLAEKQHAATGYS